MMRRLFRLCILATVALAVGCDSDGGSEASVTPSPSVPATVAASTALPTASPTTVAQTTPPNEVASPPPRTVWLIDIAAEAVHTLFEDVDQVPWGVEFVGPESVRVGMPSGEWETFGADGQPAPDPLDHDCRESSTGVTVDGVHYPELSSCWSLSPTGGHALYSANIGSDQSWDQWVVDLETGERTLLQEHLRHCGGCDGRFGPVWSPAGRYVLIPELVGDGWLYLSDVESGATRIVGQGTDITYRPSWSPDDDDLFLVHTEDDETALIDAATGEVTALPLAWPASFDSSGRFVYSPSGDALEDALQETTVFDLQAGSLTHLPGVTDWYYLRWGTPVVAGSTEGFTAVLEADGCNGSVIYATGHDVRCVEDASGGAPSPDGGRVALARLIPGGGVTYRGIAFPQYELILFDVATGEVEVIAEGAYSGEDHPNLRIPPRMEWNGSGALLLVVWPQFAGN